MEQSDARRIREGLEGEGERSRLVVSEQAAPMASIEDGEGSHATRLPNVLTVINMMRNDSLRPATVGDFMSAERPSIMFVCVHNAGRSQMGAAYAQHLSGGAVEVRSAGSAPADSVNPAVREALLEEGIDISAERPKILTPEAVQASDVVITMGCGDACPYFPGKRYLDWTLADPAGHGVEAVRPIRDEIRRRVTELLGELGVEVQPLPHEH